MKDLFAKIYSRLDNQAINALLIALLAEYLIIKAAVFALIASGVENAIVLSCAYIATIALLLSLLPSMARSVKRANAKVREAEALERWIAKALWFAAVIAGCILWLITTFAIATMPFNGAFGIEVDPYEMFPIARNVFLIGILGMVYPASYKVAGLAMRKWNTL